MSQKSDSDGLPESPGVDRDDTICAEHREGKSGESHEWRRGRRGRTRVVTCHPKGADNA